MKTTSEKLQEIRENSYDLDFGPTFGEAFENYKKIALIGGIVFIIMLAVFAIFGFGFAIALYGFSSFSETLSNLKPTNYSGVASVMYLVIVVLITALIAPIYAGLLKIAQLADNKQEFSVGTAFEYYKSQYLKEILVAMIIISAFNFGIKFIFDTLDFKIIAILINYVISFFTFLTLPFIIFGNLKATQAIQASFMIVSKQIAVLLGLLIVSVLAVCLGIFGFCIGIFFTLPFLFSLYYVIYKNIIGINETSEIDEIGNDLE